MLLPSRLGPSSGYMIARWAGGHRELRLRFQLRDMRYTYILVSVSYQYYATKQARINVESDTFPFIVSYATCAHLHIENCTAAQ